MPLRRLLHGMALLALCAAYLEGGITKLMDFGGALAEMQHFGLQPAAPLAVAVIALELGLSPATVRTYLRDAYQRLGVDNRVALIHRLAALDGAAAS